MDVAGAGIYLSGVGADTIAATEECVFGAGPAKAKSPDLTPGR